MNICRHCLVNYVTTPNSDLCVSCRAAQQKADDMNPKCCVVQDDDVVCNQPSVDTWYFDVEGKGTFVVSVCQSDYYRLLRIPVTAIWQLIEAGKLKGTWK